jgi:hypothetical protein
MDIHLHSESIVDQRTGVVNAASEYVENLRALEREVQRCDDAIADLKDSMKEAKARREKAIAQMRSAIREGKVLPLLDAAADADEGDADEGETDETDA